MIEPDHPMLSVRRQCEIIALPRSTFDYKAVPADNDTLRLMHAIDALAVRFPYWGSRTVVLELRSQGWVINRKRIQRLRRVMRIESLALKPSTTMPNKAHEKYPYLLRKLAIVPPNQVWATDITYIPRAAGFAYLVAVIDWYSRKILSWRLSNTLDDSFCVAALKEALQRFGAPEIFNSDQGSQFTGDDFIQVLKAAQLRISMDGKGRWVDNVFVERRWRSLKYEDLYIRGYGTMAEARAGIGTYLTHFNTTRRHHGLGNDTPDAVYCRKEDNATRSSDRQLHSIMTNDNQRIAA